MDNHSALRDVFSAYLLDQIVASGDHQTLGEIKSFLLAPVLAELTLDPDRLTARTPLRTRTVMLDDIVRVRPMKLPSGVVVFEIRGQRPVLTIATKGVRAFTDELVTRRPTMPISSAGRRSSPSAYQAGLAQTADESDRLRRYARVPV